MQTSYYKYINLLIRILLGIGALWFIYDYFQGNWTSYKAELKQVNPNFNYILIVILLVFINWGMEAFKWKYAIKQVEQITFVKAFSATITGVTASIITPNRVGEIPFRAMYVAKDNLGVLTAKTLVSSFSQLVVTLVIGLIGLIMTIELYPVSWNLSFMHVLFVSLTILILLFYFNVRMIHGLVKRLKLRWINQYLDNLEHFKSIDLLKLLCMSLLRYIVFSFQFYLVLCAFDVALVGYRELMLVPVCFMIASIIPTILLSEIGVRGSVALFVFGLVSEAGVSIIMASVVLWLLNVALPGMIGIPGLRRLKVFK